MELDLFSASDDVTTPLLIDLGDAKLHYYANFLAPNCADQSMSVLLEEIAWRQEFIKMYGVSRPIPRLSAWYGDQGVRYSYSGIASPENIWTSELLRLRGLVEQLTGVKFNGVLANLYRDGRDSVSWHSDDEAVLGPDPIVASLSLGQTRRFQLKHKQAMFESVSLDLTHGSLLVMKAGTQRNWLHQIPKSSCSLTERVNLTFRKVFR